MKATFHWLSLVVAINFGWQILEKSSHAKKHRRVYRCRLQSWWKCVWFVKKNKQDLCNVCSNYFYVVFIAFYILNSGFTFLLTIFLFFFLCSVLSFTFSRDTLLWIFYSVLLNSKCNYSKRDSNLISKLFFIWFNYRCVFAVLAPVFVNYVRGLPCHWRKNRSC